MGNHDLVTMGLSQMLAPYPDRVTMLGNAMPQRSKADLVLMDPCVDLADATSAEAVTASVSLGRQLVIYTWASSTGPGGLERLQATGWPIRGWLSKTLPADQLVGALERIQHGELVVLDQSPTKRRHLRAVPVPPAISCHLTLRESEVISLIAQGMTNQQIADAMFLSVNSVKSYIRGSYRKMGVTSRTQAVLWSVHHSLDLVPSQVVSGLRRQYDPGQRA